MIQRVEMYVTKTDIQQIGKIVREGVDTKLLERQSNRISIYEVMYHNTKLMIVYDKMRHIPVTVLI